MSLRLFLIIFLFSNFKSFAQFQFTGNVNNEFKNATVYLSLVEDCNKKSLFFTETILLESKINLEGIFIFKGDFLPQTNQIYKIHIDNCNNNINDYKHLLNHCEDSKEIIFIANNTDKIHFPLNDLSQMFCDIEQTNEANISILKIENLQENTLSNLQNAKSDRQRKNIYQNSFKKLQNYSKQFNEPLAELYAYYLYANEHSISRDFYVNDLKKSDYYNDLLNRLEKKYPNSEYTKRYKHTLIKDQYPLLKSSNTIYKYLAIGLSFLLIISLIFNYLQSEKNKNKAVAKEVIDYKKILTTQEQKVFELMLENSNKEIADKLFVSLSTIKSHINNIYTKLSISSRKDINQFF